MFLMPAGVILDLWVYPEHVREFFQLRLSVLYWRQVGGLFTRRLSACDITRLLGVPIAILPGFFIALMILVTEGPVHRITPD